ncbi:IS3 family transposase, partial [Streptococcus pneumoniae]
KENRQQRQTCIRDNNKRIKIKLKGLSSVQYRTKSFG